MTITEFIVKLGFDADVAPMERFEEGMHAIKNGALGLGATMTAAAGAVWGLASHTAFAELHAQRLAAMAGVTKHELEKLGHAAEMSGLSEDEMTTSLTRLNRAMYAAVTGGAQQSRAFMNLGVRVTDANGKLRSTDDVLMDISDKFARMKDGPRKTALAMELFGRSGATMIPLLSKGSAEFRRLGEEAEEFGLILDDKASAAAMDFGRNLKMLGAQAHGFKNMVSAAVLPSLVAITTNLIKLVNRNREAIKTNLNGIMKTFATYLERSARFVGYLISSLSGLSHMLSGLGGLLNVVLTAFGILSGLSIVYGIGRLTQALFGLVAGIMKVNFSAMLIPILIGAAVAALFLIFEDIYTFLHGGESYFGDFVDWVTESAESFYNWLEPLAKIGDAIREFIDKPIDAATEALSELFGWFEKISGFSISKSFDGLVDGAMSLLGQTPSSSPVSSGSQYSNSQQSVTAPVTVNVGSNVDPAAVGDAVSSSMKDTLPEILRSTNRATAVGGY